MLIGMKCKVGNRTDHSHDDFKSFEGVIASEAQMNGEGDFMVIVLVDAKLVLVDTYFVYDVTAA